MLLVLVAIECTIERPCNRKNVDIREISVHSHFESGEDEDLAMTTSSSRTIPLPSSSEYPYHMLPNP
jgi:hypothetical protein